MSWRKQGARWTRRIGRLTAVLDWVPGKDPQRKMTEEEYWMWGRPIRTGWRITLLYNGAIVFIGHWRRFATLFGAKIAAERMMRIRAGRVSQGL